MADKLMIVTGEASGDVYGSLLVEDIKRLDPDIEITGVGGDRMRAAGVETFLDSDDLSVVGFWEAITRLAELRNALSMVKKRIVRERPDLLILIDYPGMNLRIADFARTKGVKVMYYVSPQIWAWGRNRLKLIKRNVDKMVVILPFEVDIYESEGVDVTYVGHPLIDIVKVDQNREQFLSSAGIDGSNQVVALLPGSRIQEIRHHIRPLIQTAGMLKQHLPSTEFVLLSLPRFKDHLESEVAGAGVDIKVATDRKYETIKYSDLVIACSGTVTLEVALLGTPMIVIYKLALFSWALGRMIVKVPFISLANLVAGEEVVPEYIQGAVNPKALAQEAADLLANDERRRRMTDQLETIRQCLGPGGATARTAELALSMMAR